MWRMGKEIHSARRYLLGAFCAPIPGNQRVSKTVKVDFPCPWGEEIATVLAAWGTAEASDPALRMTWSCAARLSLFQQRTAQELSLDLEKVDSWLVRSRKHTGAHELKF